jgi:arylsulfatase
MNFTYQIRIITLMMLVLSVGCGNEEPKAPNIVLIMADDLGFSDLGSYGGEIETPNLDKLAFDGLRFTQFNNTGRCWPTRASLLTGYYPQQIGRDNAPGIEGGGNGKRPDWAQLLPIHLQKKGYHSYHSGKWHIDGMPLENGFERSYYLKDQHRFFSPQVHFENDSLLPPVERGTGYYGTVEIANKAILQLKEHHQVNPNNPFFSYIAFTAPHFPLHALPEDIRKVGDRYKEGWEIIREKRWERIRKMQLLSGELSNVERTLGPPYHQPKAYEILGEGEVDKPLPWNSLTQIQKQFQQDKMTIHAAMIERMDLEIGRVIEQLKAMNALENTLIIFLSDNGASAEIMVRADGHDPTAEPGSASSHLCLGPGWSTTSNTPFRKHKTWVHEGGTCTPFIVHWPDGIKGKGELRHSNAHVIDVVPTLLEIAGLPVEVLAKEALPGESLAHKFEEDAERSNNLWWYHGGNKAVRVGDWKLVAAKNEPWELFNLQSDRTESTNLADLHPEKVLQLEKEWLALLDGMKRSIEGNKDIENGNF